MVNDSININIRTTTSHLNSLKYKKKNTTTYDVKNQSPLLEQEQICGGVKPVNVIPTILLLIIGCGLLWNSVQLL